MDKRAEVARLLRDRVPVREIQRRLRPIDNQLIRDVAKELKANPPAPAEEPAVSEPRTCRACRKPLTGKPVYCDECDSRVHPECLVDTAREGVMCRTCWTDSGKPTLKPKDPPGPDVQAVTYDRWQTTADLEDHPLAAIFPIMERPGLEDLGADMKENDQREAAWLFEGKILDGRNRYRAAKLAGIPVWVREYKGKNPLAFVIGKNLHRRHLTESQRAWVAARIANAKRGRPLDEGVNGGDSPHLTTTQAADLLGVGTDLVKDAKAVQAHGIPELVAAVEAGTVSVSAAAEVAKLPEQEQKEAVAGGPEQVKATAKKKRKKPDPTAPSGEVSGDHRPCPYCRDAGEVKPGCEACNGTNRVTVAEAERGERAVAIKNGTAPANPDTKTGPGTVGVDFGGAGDAKKLADSLVRLVKRVRAGVSCLLGSLHGEQVRNVFTSHAVTELHKTGETVDLGTYGGVIRVGPPEWTCTAMDELGGQLASAAMLLDRLDRRPAERNGEGPALPWEELVADADRDF